MSIKPHNNNLSIHLKALEQQAGIIPKKSKWEKNEQTQGWNQNHRNKPNIPCLHMKNNFDKIAYDSLILYDETYL